MQFQVPQFIEVEDKIFGPLTFKQFVYLAGGAGIAYIIWRALPVYIAGPLVVVFAGLGVSLAFFQYNGRPFILALEHGFFYLIRSKLYLWSNEEAKKAHTKHPELTATSTVPYIPHLSESKLHDLSWSLDINERISAGTVGRDSEEGQKARGDSMALIHTAKDALVR